VKQKGKPRLRSHSAATDVFSRISFARASFLDGVARIFDFTGTLSEYNRSRTGEEADYQALLSDWLAVGDDIREASQLVGVGKSVL